MAHWEERMYGPTPQFTITELYADAEVGLSGIAATIQYALHELMGDDSRGTLKLLDRPIKDTSFGGALEYMYAYAFGAIWPKDLRLTEGGFDQLEVFISLLQSEDMAHQEERAHLIYRLRDLARARSVTDLQFSTFADQFEYPAASSALSYPELALLSNLSVGTLRNRVSAKRFPVKTQRVGREVEFRVDQALEWLKKERSFVQTRLLDAEEFGSRMTTYLAAWSLGGLKPTGGA